MDEQPTMEELWALLQEQRAMMEEQRGEIASLKEQLAAQLQQAAVASNGHENSSVSIERRLSRAGLLKAAAAGVAGLAAAGMAGEPRPALAAVGSETVVSSNHLIADGGTHDAIFTNGLNYARGAALQGQSFGVYAQSVTTVQGVLGNGIGVQGDSGAGTGVKGTTSTARRLGIRGPIVGGTGVDGESLAGVGVRGLAHANTPPPPGTSYIPGIGVLGVETSNRGTGVAGRSFADRTQTTLGAGTGVQGVSGSGPGVQGKSASGIGVQGDSDNLIGVQGTTTSNLFGVYGRNIANRGIGVTGRVYTDGSQKTLGAGVGVLGESGTSFGVWGTTIGQAGVLGSAYADGTHASLGGGTGVWGQSGSGSGVKGTSNSTGVLGQSGNGGTGVHGTATGTGTGVWGEGGVGIRGYSSGSQLTGVYGINTANDGVGVAGRSYADGNQNALGAGYGVWGDTGSGIGVKGTATTGRGGVFGGGAAQLQLLPANQGATPPAGGQTGDLFLDANAKLWLCTAGATNGTGAVWSTLATGAGGGGGTSPVVAHSHAAGTPGVLGDNDSNDAKSMGLSGQSLDNAGNPGNGFGVQGSSGNGAGVRGVSYLDATQTKLGLGDGVRGESGLGNGVYGKCDQGIGVRAETNGDSVPALYARNGSLVSGTGLQALAEGMAVDARSDTGIAVNGLSTSGRGGVFSGGPAQLQLKPGATRPSSGQTGDLYFDQNSQLWLCTAGGDPATWKLVQLV